MYVPSLTFESLRVNQEIFLFVVLTLVLLLNTFVSVALFRSGVYSKGQVVAQSAIVWLVPLLGAALVGLFLLSQGTRQKASDGGSEHENWQNAEAKSFGEGTGD